MYYKKNVCSEYDYLIGKEKEQIEKILHQKLDHQPRYSKFDFANDSTLVELKTRSITSTKYNTTFVNIEKILNVPPTKNVYFFFKFTNELRYIKYDSVLFSTFKIQTTYLKQREALVKNLLIPIDLLTVAK